MEWTEAAFGFTGKIGPVKPERTRLCRISRPIDCGWREAPTTAIDRGRRMAESERSMAFSPGRRRLVYNESMTPEAAPILGRMLLVVGIVLAAAGLFLLLAPRLRSEERRVGKECRSRWSPYH